MTSHPPKASIADRLERINEIWYQPIMDSIIADLRAQEKTLREAIEDLEKLMFYKWGSATYVNDPFWLGMLAHLQKLKALLASATPKAPEGTKP